MSSSMLSVQEYIARQPIYNRRRKWLHRLLRLLGGLLCRVEVTGIENIPRSGPTILMMNHISFIDPIVFTAVVDRRYVISMAKAEVVDGWLSRLVVKGWGAFVVRRGELDRQALLSAIELLKSGQLVLIAPEGTRNPQGLQKPRDGVAYIASKADAVVVPAVIAGAQDWKQRLEGLHRCYARVSFGQPFRFRLPEGARLNRETRATMMQEAMYQMALAVPDEYASLRGVYGDIQQATTRFLELL